MIDLPANLSDAAFDSLFKRGAVVKTLFRSHDGKDKQKFLIILNHDISSDTVIFALTTSQLGFYDKNPHFNKEIIRISHGEISFFSKETIINCREVHKMSKEKLKENYQKNILQIVGNLPPDTLTGIDKIIAQSFFISSMDKEAILGKK